MHTALELGVNFFTSPYYGANRAETVLGKALRGIGRARYLLATKVGRYGDEDFDFSAERAKRSVRESPDRLGTDHVDLIQCHDIEFGDLDQIVEETLPAWRELQDAGLARFVGVTGYPIPALSYVGDRAHRHSPLILPVDPPRPPTDRWRECLAASEARYVPDITHDVINKSLTVKREITTAYVPLRVNFVASKRLDI